MPEHCAVAEKNGNCVSCVSGYEYKDGTCQKVYTPIPFCALQRNEMCMNCVKRYYLSSNQCLKVSDLCETYDQLTGECWTCIEGYTLK